jgi:predicted membrane GTPase involved in stress response
LFGAILKHIPAPQYDDTHPLQAHVTNLDASPFLGRLALLRIFNGTIRKGQTVAWVRQDGTTQNVRISELLATRALERYPTEEANPGDIVAVAGIEDITIGETLADPNDIRPLPLITVDDPAISMTIGINTSPMAGRVKGAKQKRPSANGRLVQLSIRKHVQCLTICLSFCLSGTAGRGFLIVGMSKAAWMPMLLSKPLTQDRSRQGSKQAEQARWGG